MGKQDGKEQTGSRIGKQHPDVPPRHAGKPPHGKADKSGQLIRKKHHQGVHARAQESGCGHARQDHAGGVDAVAPSQEINRQGGDQPPEEGRRRQHRIQVPGNQHHGQHSKKARAGGDADHARRGERVAHHRLQKHAGYRQARADHRPGQRARQAEVKDNLPAYAAGLHEQGPPNLAQRQVDRARTDAEKKCQCAKTGQQGQRGQARSDPMAAIKMHRHRAFPQSRQTPPDSGRLA